MHVCSDGPRIAFQPENRREELALYRLFSKLPGSWFTMDVAEYPDLDTNLATRAFETGPYAPGTRALVIDEAPEMPIARADE